MYIAHKHHGNHLILERIADEIRLLGLFPEKLWPSEDLESGGLTAIRLGTVRRSASGTENCEPICCQLSLVSVFEDYRSLGKLTVLILKDPNTGLLAEVNYLFCSVSPTIKIWLRMRNDGSCPVLVEAVYASVLYNLAVGGLRPRRCRTYIHLWSSNRGGDGKWQALALNELGHPSYRISQRYTGGGAGLNRITMGMLEDVETRTTWYWQVEPSRTCYWEFGEDDRGMLYVTAGEIGGLGANLPRNLAPGEALDTLPVTFGCVEGGRQEALAALERHYQHLFSGQKGRLGEEIPSFRVPLAGGLLCLEQPSMRDFPWMRLRFSSSYLCDSMELDYRHFYRGRT